MIFKVGQEVYTEDGRKAEYAGEIGGQTFVRIVFEQSGEDGRHEEWPSDKLTPVSRAFASAPLEKYEARVEQAEAKLAALRDEESAVRRSVLDLRKQESQTLADISKFHDLQVAIDFLEGRITHVMIESYSKVEIIPLSEALAYHDDRSFGSRTENGLKLLCLFGHEKGKPPRWAINRYYDGSGSNTTVVPFKSEAEARAELQSRADAAVIAWRIDNRLFNGVMIYKNAGASIADDFIAWLDGIVAARKAEKIAKLKAELAEAEL